MDRIGRCCSVRERRVAIQDSLHLHQQKCFVCGLGNWGWNCTGISAHLWVIISQCSLPNTLLNFLGFWMSMQSTLGKNSLQDACGCFDSPPAMRFAMAVNCTQPSNLSPFLSQTRPFPSLSTECHRAGGERCPVLHSLYCSVIDVTGASGTAGTPRGNSWLIK